MFTIHLQTCAGGLPQQATYGYRSERAVAVAVRNMAGLPAITSMELSVPEGFPPQAFEALKRDFPDLLIKEEEHA